MAAAESLQRVLQFRAHPAIHDEDRAENARLRQRRYRQRQKSGLLAVTVEIDEVGMAEKLRETGYLNGRDDREALAAALQRMLADLAVVSLR